MMKHLVILIAAPVALLATFVSADEPKPTLAQRLQPLIQAHRGRVTVAVKHLDFGDEYNHGADERMPEWGCPNTKINAKVFRGSTTSIDPERTKKFGLGSTTAREAVQLLEKLHQGKLVSPEACKEMIGHLKKCEDKTKLKRFLPEKIEVAHKTGSVSDI